MSRPQFFLVAGPNGAGKSSAAEGFRLRFPKAHYINADTIASEIAGSVDTANQARLAAGRKAVERVRYHITNGLPFMVESTIAGTSYLRHAQRANDAGFRTILLYIGLESAQLSVERVATRVSLGGHDIPTRDLMRRYTKSLSNLRAHIGVFENAYVLDNSGESIKWLASYRDGMIRNVVTTIPAWLQPYLH